MQPPVFYITDTLQTTELDRSQVVCLPQRGARGWREQYVRWRTTALARFQLQLFPFDQHKLRVVVKLPRASHNQVRL